MEAVGPVYRGSTESNQPTVKPNLSKNRIQSLVQELQQDWQAYERLPGGALRRRIQYHMDQLSKAIEKVDVVGQETLLQETKDFLYASKLQLEEADTYSKSFKTDKTTIAKDDLPMRKADFVKGSATTLRDGLKRDYECRQLLQADGLDVRDVKGDGACGIRALVKVAYPDADEDVMTDVLRGDLVEMLRNTMKNEVDSGEYHLSADIVSPDKNKLMQKRQVDRYCNQMRKGSTWIGQQELVTFAEQVLKRPIWVYRPDGLTLNAQGKLEPLDAYKHGAHLRGEPLRLYHSASHYQALVPHRAAA